MATMNKDEPKAEPTVNEAVAKMFEIAKLDISPLTEAQPESIDELMSRDPLELTADNIASIVKILRDQRKNWKKETAAKPKAPAGNITLDQLKIEL